MGRNVDVFIQNSTPFELTLLGGELSHGEWVATPKVIAARKHVIVTSQSNGFFTGTTARISYAISGGGKLTVFWSNPYVGTNTYNHELLDQRLLSNHRGSSGAYSTMLVNLWLPTVYGQTGWKLCSKCKAVVFDATPSVCPAGGAHEGGLGVVLTQNISGAPGQTHWRWCKNCQAVHSIKTKIGLCPAGKQHEVSGSGTYHIVENSFPPVQHAGNFGECVKCRCLVAGGAPCVARGGHERNGRAKHVLVTAAWPNNALAPMA